MSDLYTRRKGKGAFLLNSIVRRKGETESAKHWSSVADVINVRPKNGEELAIHFTIPAGGQGQSALAVAIKPEDFGSVIAMMAATDRDATLRALAEEIRYQLCSGSK